MLTIACKFDLTVQAGTPMIVKGEGALPDVGQGVSRFFFSEISSGVRGQTAPGRAKEAGGRA